MKNKTTTVIRDVYHNIESNPFKLPTYVITFGNKAHGWACEKEDLKDLWKIAIYNSKTIDYGDVSLFRNGVLIRAAHNLNFKILDIDKEYRCFYCKCINNIMVRHYENNIK